MCSHLVFDKASSIGRIPDTVLYVGSWWQVEIQTYPEKLDETVASALLIILFDAVRAILVDRMFLTHMIAIVRRCGASGRSCPCSFSATRLRRVDAARHSCSVDMAFERSACHVHAHGFTYRKRRTASKFAVQPSFLRCPESLLTVTLSGMVP